MKGFQEFMAFPDRIDQILKRLDKVEQRIFKEKGLLSKQTKSAIPRALQFAMPFQVLRLREFARRDSARRMLSSREDVVDVGRHDFAPWLFVAPAAIIFAVYVVIPIFQSFWLSLFDWDGITVEKEFIGLANYEQLFQDEQFWTSLRNNLYWLIFFLARAGWRCCHSHFSQPAIPRECDL